MPHYLNRFEPEDVRFLLDLAEFKDAVFDMLEDVRESVKVEISYEILDEPDGEALIRPIIQLQEKKAFSEEDLETFRRSGFSIDGQSFANGDYAMQQIFGTDYRILAVTEDEDGPFFTIEMPYRDFQQKIKARNLKE